MPEEKPKPRRKAAPQPKTTSTASEPVKVVPQVDPYEAASKQLTDLDERIRKIEIALASALGLDVS